jgi:CheY-like chemotaxis protein
LKDLQAKTQDLSPSNEVDASDRLLTAKLLKAQDEERRRISRELHDSIGQYLVAVKMNLGRLRTKLNGQAEQEFDLAERMIDDALTEVRTVSHLLHPPDLELLGLRASMIWYAEGFQKRSGIKISVDLPESLPRLKPDAETALFRVAQECLTNARRHANASHVDLRMAANADQFQMEVTDNGKGFSDLENCRQGVGILGMQERLNELGGTLHVESGKGTGSSVIATIPLPQNLLAQPRRLPAPQAKSGLVADRARIFLVDDHALLRRGVRALLETQPDFEVCGEAGAAREAIESIQQLRPDLVLLDLQLPDADGWHVIREVRRSALAVKILVFSHHEVSYVQRSAKNAGCHGSVSKAGTPAELLDAIRTVLAGNTYFGPLAYAASP